MSTSTIADSIQGALMLAKFDRRGLGAFDGSKASARASFKVAWFLIALYAISAVLISSTFPDAAQTMSDMSDGDIEPPPADLLVRFGAVAVLAQIVAWLTLLSFLHGFLAKGEMTHRFPTAVAAYNWTLLWRRAVELIPVVLGVAGFGGSLGLIYILVSGYSIAYLYFTMKVALEGNRFESAMIVLTEIGLNLIVPAAALMALSLAYFGTSDLQALFEALPQSEISISTETGNASSSP